MSSTPAPELIGRAPGGRKLIAVVYADVVGYSRLIGLDDVGTLERLRSLRSTLIDPAINEHGGRIVQTGGDSLLMVFDSIDGAVRCAVKVQQRMPVYDGDHRPDRTIRFRLGINIGDVIADGADLHGDSVNVAVRLQAECPPGGICVSRAVRDHVQDRLNLPFEALGALELKNIARPVEVFLLRLDAAAAVAAPGPADTLPDLSMGKAPRLSIAVLPFQSLSGGSSDDYLADVITDDITTDLSHLTNAFVIACESAYTENGKAIDVRRVGEQLGVRYVLEGSVRRLGDVLRVNVQLISTETGVHLWADRFDEQIKNLHAGQEEIVIRIGNALGWEMVRVEAARSARERPANPDALDLYLRARLLLSQPYNLGRHAEACALLERAVQLDPSFAVAKAYLAGALINLDVHSPDGTTEDRLARAATLMSEAAAFEAESNIILFLRVFLLRRQRRWPEALATAQRMMDLYPNYAESGYQLATMKLVTGAADEAIPLFEKAIRRDPRPSLLYNRYRRLGYALLVSGREQESIPWFQRALAAIADSEPAVRAPIYRMLAAAYALTGQADDAHRAAAEAVRLDPFATAWSDVQYNTNEMAVAQTRHYLGGLRLAGLRDHADEDADFGVASDGKLHRVIQGYSPTTVPGATTIRTVDLVSLLAESRPIVIDTLVNYLGRSILGAVGLFRSGLGGDFSDSAQNRLRRKMEELTKGRMSSPIVAVGWSSERFDGYNLTLRLVALGYTKVSWYRGGREAWGVAGLPETKLDIQDW